MPDLAESALEYIDRPIYDFDLSIDESRLEFAGAVTGPTFVIVPPPPVPAPAAPTVRFESSLSTSSDYGTDVLVFPGMDPDLNLSSGGRVLAEAIARRLTTPRGSLPFHEEYGLDVRSYLNETMTSDALYRLKTAIERECEADERVESASVALTFTPAAHRLAVRIELVTAQGPFRFTLSVSQVTVELLSEA